MKRFLSFFIAVMLIIGVFPMGVFAEDLSREISNADSQKFDFYFPEEIFDKCGFSFSDGILWSNTTEVTEDMWKNACLAAGKDAGRIVIKTVAERPGKDFNTVKILSTTTELNTVSEIESAVANGSNVDVIPLNNTGRANFEISLAGIEKNVENGTTTLKVSPNAGTKYYYFIWSNSNGSVANVYETFRFDLNETGTVTQFSFIVSEDDYYGVYDKVSGVGYDIPEELVQDGAEGFFSTNDGRAGIDIPNVKKDTWINLLRNSSVKLARVNAQVKIQCPEEKFDKAVLYKSVEKISEGEVNTQLASAAAETVSVVNEVAEFGAPLFFVEYNNGICKGEAKDGREYWYIKWIDTETESSKIELMQFDTYAGGDQKVTFSMKENVLYPDEITKSEIITGTNSNFSASFSKGWVNYEYIGSEKKASVVAENLKNIVITTTIKAPEGYSVRAEGSETFGATAEISVPCINEGKLNDEKQTVLVYFKSGTEEFPKKIDIRIIFNNVENDLAEAEFPFVEDFHREFPIEIDAHTGSWFDSHTGETGVSTIEVTEEEWIAAVKSVGEGEPYVAITAGIRPNDNHMDKAAVYKSDKKLSYKEIGAIIGGLEEGDFQYCDDRNRIYNDIPVLDINVKDEKIELKANDYLQYWYVIWVDEQGGEGNNVSVEMIEVKVEASHNGSDIFCKEYDKIFIFPEKIDQNEITADNNEDFEAYVKKGSVVYSYIGSAKGVNQIKNAVKDTVLSTEVEISATEGFVPVSYKFGAESGTLAENAESVVLNMPCIDKNGELNEINETATINFKDENGNSISMVVDIALDFKEARDSSTVPDFVELIVPDPLKPYVEWTYGDNEDGTYGLIDAFIKKAPIEVWQEVYSELSPEDGDILFSVEGTIPDEFDKVRQENTGWEYTLEDFIEMTQDPYDPVFDGNDGRYGSGVWIAQINRSGKSAIITLGGTHEAVYIAMVDYDDLDENGKPKIVRKAVEIRVTSEKNEKGENQQYVFEDVFKAAGFVDENRISYNAENSSLFVPSYDEETGTVTFTYNGEQTTYDGLLSELKNLRNDMLSVWVEAPEGFEAYRILSDSMNMTFEDEEDRDMMWHHIGILGGDYINSTDTATLFWVDRNGEKYTEKLIIEIDIGDINRRTWMDKYWNPAIYGSGRLNLSANLGYLEENGLVLDIDNGHIVSGFEGKVVPENIAYVDAYIIPPEGATHYRENQSGGNGNIIYSNHSESQKQHVENSDLLSVEDNGYPSLTVGNIEPFEIDGITVWLAYGIDRTQVLVVNWYDKDGKQIGQKGDYIYFNGGDCVQVSETDAISSITEMVTDPTPLGSGWFLTCKQFAQQGNEKNYYFRLEAGGDVPGSDTEKIVYLPYSFIEEGLTYDEAQERGLNPKLHHYDDGHNELEMIPGELTPYGIKFVTKSFSPFVLDWGEDDNQTEEEDRIVIEGLTEVPEGLEKKFDSVDEIKAALEEKVISESKFSEKKAKVVFMEITLQTKDESGNWVEVTEENFPEEGLEVCIPYPEGTDAKKFKFSVAHLISSGRNVGKIEVLDPEETEEGLVVRVYSLSPFAVAYEEKTFFDILEEWGGFGTGTSGTGTGAGITITNGKKEDEGNPETGAPIILG